VFALEFPPLGHIVDWPGFAGTEGEWYEFNKVALVCMIAAGLSLSIFILGNKKQLVPTGAQNLAEITVEFVEQQLIEPTIGHTSKRWLAPFMTSLFLYIFFTNIFEVIPIIQMPANARIALPMFLALLCYVLYHGAGFKEHGPIGYLKHSLIPPGVPVFLLPLVALIEFVSKFLVQPFSHTVRLFANLLAGHILLVTFAVLSASLWTTQWYVIFLPLPAFAMVFFTAFEVMVSFLQAYVFTLLFGVYYGAATSHEH
jgi:F-type H+-transporting ATPase subunit a